MKTKQPNQRRRKYFTFCIIIFFLVLDLGLFILWSSTRRHIVPSSVSQGTSSDFNYKREEQRLKHTFQKTDNLKEAYTSFVREYTNYNSSIIHSLAHVVGEALFIREGMNGVLICDDAYSFGCYHGFFGLAIQKKGDNVISQAETICNRKRSATQANGCLHGLGHGLVITQGYTYNDLLQALKRCDKLFSSSRPPCYNGTFMEYNRRVPFAAYGQNLGVRPFEKKRPYEPCSRLPTPYKSECYVEQPSWWSVTVPGYSYKEKIEYIGIICEQIEETMYQDQCFRGIARAIPFKNNLEDARKDIIRYCALMPSAKGNRYCFESGIQVLLGRSDKNAEELCMYVSPPHQEDCKNATKTFACQELSLCKVQ